MNKTMKLLGKHTEETMKMGYTHLKRENGKSVRGFGALLGYDKENSE